MINFVFIVSIHYILRKNGQKSWIKNQKEKNTFY